MKGIIEKRKSLHHSLASQQKKNHDLKLQVSQLQALANVGVAMSMIAHEINNLLTPLGNYSQLALMHPHDTELVKKALTKTTKNCERASTVMQSILAMANGEKLEKSEVNLLSLVEEIFNCLCRDFSKDGITVKIEIPADLTITAVPIEIQQVMMNLILNARDAMLQNPGTLTIKAKQDKDNVKIEVKDTGKGIESADLKKIFEPFFTTKTKQDASLSGSGLGLSFCKRVIDAHKGTISVQSDLNCGTTFVIILPSKN